MRDRWGSGVVQQIAQKSKSCSIVGVQQPRDGARYLFFSWSRGRCGKACIPPQARPRPCGVAIKLVQFDCCLGQKLCQRHIFANLPKLVDQCSEGATNGGLQIVENQVGGNAIQLNLATGWEVRKAVFDLTNHAGPRGLRQRPIAVVESELPRGLADEI